jgi:hypothetical protein
MAGSSPTPGPAEDAPTPRWVYVAGVALIFIALVFVVMHLTSGGIPSH